MSASGVSVCFLLCSVLCFQHLTQCVAQTLTLSNSNSSSHHLSGARSQDASNLFPLRQQADESSSRVQAQPPRASAQGRGHGLRRSAYISLPTPSCSGQGQRVSRLGRGMGPGPPCCLGVSEGLQSFPSTPRPLPQEPAAWPGQQRQRSAPHFSPSTLRRGVCTHLPDRR